MTYMGWQITDMKQPLSKSIQQALEYHERKYGRVPNIVEHGKIEPPPLPGVRYVPIRIPPNILLVGVE
jgi:hypothetical protein